MAPVPPPGAPVTAPRLDRPASSPRRWHPEPLFIKIALAVSLTLVCTLTPVFYFVAQGHFEAALEIKREEALAVGDLLVAALEHEMLVDDLSGLEELMHRYPVPATDRRVMVLDREGRVRFTNDASAEGTALDSSSPTCQVCHSKPPEERLRSATVELGDQPFIRTVHPIRNREECHECHEEAYRINGIVLTDSNVSALRAKLAADVRLLAIVVALTAFVILATIGLLVHRLVLRPLSHLEASTRAMGDGDFSKRVEVSGDDAVSRVGAEFNAMATSISELLDELRQEHRKLERVMNSVDDGLLVIDRDMAVIGVNDAFLRRLDVARSDVLGHRCCAVWGERSDCAARHAIGDCPTLGCFDRGQVRKAVRLRYTADGETRDEEVFASPVYGPDGRVEQVVEVWRDISERKSQEARMAEFHRLASLGMLASGFSHELNTPLGTVLLCAEAIGGSVAHLDSGASTQKIGEHAKLIRSEIARCRALTQQFLRLSRGQSLTQDLVELPALVESTLPLVAHAAKEAGVALRVLDAPGRPVVLANAGAVQQVLLNLVLNAISASRPGSEVRLGWEVNGRVALKVVDDGIGMTAEVRSKVFEPFFSQRTGGTGLGLFISMNLTRQWGGDILVQSVPGQGSTFEVLFPPRDRA